MTTQAKMATGGNATGNNTTGGNANGNAAINRAMSDAEAQRQSDIATLCETITANLVHGGENWQAEVLRRVPRLLQMMRGGFGNEQATYDCPVVTLTSYDINEYYSDNDLIDLVWAVMIAIKKRKGCARYALTQVRTAANELLQYLSQV